MKRRSVYSLVLTALFTSLVCIFTMVIRIPTIGTTGYVNIGDTAVLLSSWMLGGWYGIFAAGTGSAMADLLSGYPAYIPGTFFIKAMMAAMSFVILQAVREKRLPHAIAPVLSALPAELLMVIGYFFYEAIFLGYGLAAAASVISNTLQGITNLILSCILIKIFEQAKVWKGVSYVQ